MNKVNLFTCSCYTHSRVWFYFYIYFLITLSIKLIMCLSNLFNVLKLKIYIYYLLLRWSRVWLVASEKGKFYILVFILTLFSLSLHQWLCVSTRWWLSNSSQRWGVLKRSCKASRGRLRSWEVWSIHTSSSSSTALRLRLRYVHRLCKTVWR